MYFNITLLPLLQRIFCRCTIFKAAYPHAAVLHSLYCRITQKIGAITWGTRTYSGAENCSCSLAAYSCTRGMTKSTLFLSFTHTISTQQRSGNLTWQFYSLKSTIITLKHFSILLQYHQKLYPWNMMKFPFSFIETKTSVYWL